MHKTKIEWTDYTWNPIKGICPVGCWYCYARKMYKRFGWNPEVRLDGELFGSCQDAFAPNIKIYEMLDRIKPGSKIFICSTCELFHPKIHKEWRDAIFQAIKENPQYTFQILTKFPQNIDRPMPDNVWLGVTVTKEDELDRLMYLSSVQAKNRNKAKIRFVSFEPLLEHIQWGGYRVEFSSLDWIIVGQLTGHGKLYEPFPFWISQIKIYAGHYGIPLFMKNNLKKIWGDPLIQEFPDV